MGGIFGGGSKPAPVIMPPPVAPAAYEPRPPEDKGGPSAAELKAAKDRQRRLAATQQRDAFRVDLAFGQGGSGLSIREHTLGGEA